MSQLDLALEAEVSSRHVSFVETGRASASRDMLLRLAECLEIPLRAQNALLHVAGYAPAYVERPIDDPELDAVRTVLTAYEPFPALAVDRHWNLVMANRAVEPLLAGVHPDLLAPPVNVLRLSLHPNGMAPFIENLPEWRAHLLARLRAQAHATGDILLATLHRELCELSSGPRERSSLATTRIAVPLRLTIDGQRLSFLSTTTVFGTPLDVTLSELAIEAFLPADEETRTRIGTVSPGSRRRRKSTSGKALPSEASNRGLG